MKLMDSEGKSVCLELISQRSSTEKKSMASEKECQQETELKFWPEEEPKAERDWHINFIGRAYVDFKN